MNHKQYKHKIFGGKIKAVEISLNPQQQIKVDIKDLIYKENGVELTKRERSAAYFKNLTEKPKVITFLM